MLWLCVNASVGPCDTSRSTIKTAKDIKTQKRDTIVPVLSFSEANDIDEILIRSIPNPMGRQTHVG